MGRYCNLDISERKCNLCKKLVEDEIYFLIQCKCLTTVRKQYLKCDRLKNNKKNLSNLSDGNTLTWLLSNEDTDIIYMIHNFF